VKNQLKFPVILVNCFYKEQIFFNHREFILGEVDFPAVFEQAANPANPQMCGHYIIFG